MALTELAIVSEPGAREDSVVVSDELKRLDDLEEARITTTPTSSPTLAICESDTSHLDTDLDLICAPSSSPSEAIPSDDVASEPLSFPPSSSPVPEVSSSPVLSSDAALFTSNGEREQSSTPSSSPYSTSESARIQEQSIVAGHDSPVHISPAHIRIQTLQWTSPPAENIGVSDSADQQQVERVLKECGHANNCQQGAGPIGKCNHEETYSSSRPQLDVAPERDALESQSNQLECHLQDGHVIPQKRKHEGVEEPVETLITTGQHTPEHHGCQNPILIQSDRSSPRDTVPNTKRATLASQAIQLEKLKKPFRPPAITLAERPPSKKSAACDDTPKLPEKLDKVKAEPKNAQKFRTKRAAAQYKCPLRDTAQNIPRVRLTPNIQALERRVQVLKRALKISHEGEEQILQKLVQTWTLAGREAAWQLWELVKERAQEGAVSTSRQDSWGWAGADAESPNIERHDRQSTGSNDEEDKNKNTLGMMLLQLGIAHETLGWNEEEEVFED